MDKMSRCISKRDGPDVGKSWLIAFSCGLVFFSIFGLVKSSGIIYVALIQQFNVTREEAAWPLALSDTVISLAGPLPGILNFWMSKRLITFVGCFISALGVGLCFFSKSILSYMICLGVIYGLGAGIGATLLPVVTNEYFVRHRTTAIGICFAGSSLGSFVFPFLMDYLNRQYGLNGSFLLLSGVCLQSLIGASFLKSPSWLQKQKIKKSPNKKMIDLSEQPVKQDLGNILELLDVNVIKTETDFPENKFAVGSCDNKDTEKDSGPVTVSKKITIACNNAYRTVQPVLFTPRCYVVYLNHLVYFTSYYTYITVITDYSIDNGITGKRPIYILTSFSIIDLAGRLFSGWITDKQMLNASTFCIINIALLGVILLLTPLAHCFPSILTITLIIGLIVGITLSPIHLVASDYMGPQNFGLTIGISYFLYGIFTLMRPAFLGYFRDTRGSYNGLFTVLGVSCIISSVIWTCERIIQTCKPKTTSKKDQEI